MDVLKTTFEVIKLVKQVYDKVCEYKEADKTIANLGLGLRGVEVRLEVFSTWLQSHEHATAPRWKATLHLLLDKVRELIQDLGAKLPSGHRVHHKIAWVGWEKRSADQLLANLRLWMEDVQGTVFALDMLAEVRGDGQLYNRLFDTGERALTGAWALRQRIEANDHSSIQVISHSDIHYNDLADDFHILATLHDRIVYTEMYSMKSERAQGLATILDSADMPSMHLLRCIGIVDQGKEKVLVYELPPDTFSSLESAAEPLPTLALLLRKGASFTVEDRYRIASEIATAVFEIHAAGWVHEDIQSSNILIDVGHWVPNTCIASFGASFLVGFETSRPYRPDPRLNDSDNDLWLRSLEPTPAEPTPAIKRKPKLPYQHPDRWGVSPTRFTLLHDMYSLGAVLIELAYNSTLSKLVIDLSGQPSVNHQNLCRLCRDIPNRLGSVFAAVVGLCLTLSMPNNPENDQSIREDFYEKVLRPLRELSTALRLRKINVEYPIKFVEASLPEEQPIKVEMPQELVKESQKELPQELVQESQKELHYSMDVENPYYGYPQSHYGHYPSFQHYMGQNYAHYVSMGLHHQWGERQIYSDLRVPNPSPPKQVKLSIGRFSKRFSKRNLSLILADFTKVVQCSQTPQLMRSPLPGAYGIFHLTFSDEALRDDFRQQWNLKFSSSDLKVYTGVEVHDVS